MATTYRYINLALIKQDGLTVTKQVWTDDVSTAQIQFEDMIFNAYQSKNPAVLGLIADPYFPIVRYTILDLRATIIDNKAAR